MKNQITNGAIIFALMVLGLGVNHRVLGQSTATNNGQLFDQGRAMTARSPGADPILDRMKAYVGQWDVEAITNPTDSTARVVNGWAEITYMNRGHAFQERLQLEPAAPRTAQFEHMGFLVYQSSTAQWVLGEVNTLTQHVEVYNGDFVAENLSLTTAVRRLGGPLLTYMKVEYNFTSDDQFAVTASSSTDNGKQWNTEYVRRYSRRAQSDGFMKTRTDNGAPAEGRSVEASQFDFLIGSWNAQQEFPNGGNPIRFPSNATAVYALGGWAILEHSWHDLDTSLPDAATTILRIYNLAERKWESLYLANRGNGMLDFGGRWEGDQMVLHQFNTHLGDSISRFVFHSIEKDGYRWYAESSTDRGLTFNKTWLIDMTRK